MKKVFVKPEMKSHRLRTNNLLITVSDENPEACRVLCPKLQCGSPYGNFGTSELPEEE